MEQDPILEEVQQDPQAEAAEHMEQMGRIEEAAEKLGGVALAGADVNPVQENYDGQPADPNANWRKAMYEVYQNLDSRLLSNSEPTPEELSLGAFVEEIEPQARNAVMAMRAKGYGADPQAGYYQDGKGNVDLNTQSVFLESPLSLEDQATLRDNGYEVIDNRLLFTTDPEESLESIQDRWDRLAEELSDMGAPALDRANAHADWFRDAARKGQLLDAYLTDNELDMSGRLNAAAEAEDVPMSPDAMLSRDPQKAAHERVTLGLYGELKDRVSGNPQPTKEELSMGMYEEEIAPQARDAMLSMRRKGYAVTYAGVAGRNYSPITLEGMTSQIEPKIQRMDIAGTMDLGVLNELAKHGVEVTAGGLSWMPEDPTNMPAIQEKWDVIAGILPDTGQPAPVSDSLNAQVFRTAMKLGEQQDYLKNWVWRTGAYDGRMPSMYITAKSDGYLGDNAFNDEGIPVEQLDQLVVARNNQWYQGRLESARAAELQKGTAFQEKYVAQIETERYLRELRDEQARRARERAA